jgi:uncharacterized protein (TIGR02246 family)
MPPVPSIAKLLALVLLFTWPGASLAVDPALREARELATRFAEGWNAHDAASFGALMAMDADWVTASGIRLRGRDKIQAYLAEEHATWAKRTSMRTLNIHVRALNAKMAIVLFEWEIATPDEGGGAPSVARGNNLFVAIDDNGWIIVSGQVARARTP